MTDLPAAPPAEAPWATLGGDWSEWLRVSRHGGHSDYAAALAPQLDAILRQLLDHAALAPGQTIADIGCGEGFAGLGALDRIGTGSVTFADVSPVLVAAARAEAERRGIAAACNFVAAPAEALDAIATGSVDVVLVRAVLAYVADRSAAMAEFHRILRPGGRISIVEPVFADGAFALAGMGQALRAEEPSPATRRLELLYRFRSAYFPATLPDIRRSPLTNYDERELLRLVERAGFSRIGLRLHIDCVPAPAMPWDAYLAVTPYAGAPRASDVLGERFTAAERIEFERFMRPGVEAGSISERNVNAYLFADRS